MTAKPGTMDDLIEELSLGSARGGRRQPAQQVRVEAVRPLTEEDLPLLANPPACGALPSIPQIRAQHHKIAQLLAQGVPGQEISLITGFSPSYISILKSAPDMQELIRYYQNQVEERAVDAMSRLKMLGVTSVEELQSRLNEAPEKFTAAQLMDMIEIGLIKPMSAAALASGTKSTSGSPIQINLNFKSPEKSLAEGPGALIEGAVK